MFRGKRGEGGAETLSLLVIVEVVLIVLVASSFFYFYTDVKEDTLFEKSHAVRDMALLMETVQHVPGNIEVYYSEPGFDVSAYNYRFEDNLVNIFEGENYLYGIYYPFSLDARWEDSFEGYAIEEPSAFVVSLVDGNFIVREKGLLEWGEVMQLTCPAITSTKLDKGSMIIVLEENDEILNAVAEQLVAYEQLGFQKRSTGTVQNTKAADLVITLKTGQSDAIGISAPSDKQSEKAGCLIGNEIANAFPEGDFFTVENTDEELSQNSDAVAIKIVIGERLLYDADALTQAIISGIEGYYEN